MDYTKILENSSFFANLYPKREPSVKELINLYGTVMKNANITASIKIFPMKGVFSKASGFGATDGERFLIGKDLLDPEYYKKLGVAGRDIWLVALYVFKAVAYHEAGHCYRYSFTQETIKEQTELLVARLKNSELPYDSQLMNFVDNVVEDWVTEHLVCPILDDLYVEIRDTFNSFFFTLENEEIEKEGLAPLHLIRSVFTRSELEALNPNLYEIGMKYFNLVTSLDFTNDSIGNKNLIKSRLQDIKFDFYSELINTKESKDQKNCKSDDALSSVSKIVSPVEAGRLTNGPVIINGERIDLTEINNSLEVGGSNSSGTKVAKIPNRYSDSKTFFVKKLYPLVRELRKEKNAISNVRNQPKGRLDKITDVFYTNAVYRDPLAINNVSYPKGIVVLLDVSGSTRNNCSDSVRSEYNADTVYQSFINVGYTFSKIFKELGIPCATIAHTTDYRDDISCKIFTLQNNLSKELPRGEFWNYHESMNNGGNSDAAALEFAAKIVRDGLVIVVSDGLPSDSHLPNVDPEEALKITTSKLNKTRTKVLAIGLDTKLSERLQEFYPFVVDMEKGNAIRKIIDKIFGR